MIRLRNATLIGIAALFIGLVPGCARQTPAPPLESPIEIESIEMLDSSMLPCETHCDCPQGEFCYKGTCVRDATPVWCCAKDGCPPGARCITPEGTSSRCGEDPDFTCTTACDCGPAHACLDVPGVGRTCVKDDDDPRLSGETMYDVAVPDGEATYCADGSECFYGAWSYEAANRTDFAAYDPWEDLTRDACGGPACMSAGDCDGYDVCVDTRPGADHVPQASCHPAGGFCMSGAIAEAMYGFSPSDILHPCEAYADAGHACEVGWREGGEHAVQAVVGTSGSCGDGDCAAWESPETCPDDCACGDGICSSSESTEGTCPSDCGTCGDGICTPPETHKACRSDCPDTVGDGSCTLRDIALGHYDDCECDDSVTYTDDPSICGDGICQRDGRIPEHYGTCPTDCFDTTVELEAVILTEQIALLHDDDTLNHGQYRALARKVTQVVDLVARDKPEEALDVLGGLETQVRDFIDVQLTDHQAAPLLGIAGGIESLIEIGAIEAQP